MTVEQALELLERDGVIRREQGRGTFYLGSPGKRTEATLSGLLESVMKYRDGAYARVIRKGIVPATPRVAAHLQVPPWLPVAEIQRVGVMDGEPVILINVWLSTELGAKILGNDDELNCNQALVSVLCDKHGVEIATVRQTIGAALADPAFAEHLGVEVGAPVLETERTYLDAQGKPVVFSSAFYRSDRYRFQVTMKEWR